MLLVVAVPPILSPVLLLFRKGFSAVDVAVVVVVAAAAAAAGFAGFAITILTDNRCLLLLLLLQVRLCSITIKPYTLNPKPVLIRKLGFLRLMSYR